MKMRSALALLVAMLAASVSSAAPQAAAAAPAQNTQKAPLYEVTLVGRSLTAINYQHRSGSTMIDFAGTPLLPLGKGGATVNSKQGRIQIDAKFSKLQP